MLQVGLDTRGTCALATELSSGLKRDFLFLISYATDFFLFVNVNIEFIELSVWLV